MALIKIKQSPNPTSQTLTSTMSSHEARLLIRETLHISANLASALVVSPSAPVESISQLMCMYEEIGLDFQLMAAQAQVEDSVLTLETIKPSSCKMGGQQHHAHLQKKILK